MSWRAEVTARLRELLHQSPDTPAALVVRSQDGPEAQGEPVPGARVLLLDDLGQDAGVATRRPHGGAPVAEASLGAVVVWFVATSPPAARRVAVLAEARRVLRADGILVVVDHNRPRTWWGRLRNAVWCALRGVDPLHRPAYPVAREVLAAGFDDVALRLACAEKIQLVRGRRVARSAS